MSQELLNQRYYITEENQMDMFYDYQFNCGQANAYMVAKTKTKDAMKLKYESVDDLTLAMALTDDDELKYTMYNSVDNMPSYFSYEVCPQKDEDAIQVLHEYLDAGEPALIATHCELLEFSSFYNPSIDLSIMDPDAIGHVFLIVHYDSDYYYFVEDPFEQINYKVFDSYQGRRDLGRYPRDKMEEVFRTYLRIIRLFFDWEQEDLPYIRCKLSMEASIQNYYKEDGIDKYNLNYICGRNAIQKMCQFAERENISYDYYVPNLCISFADMLNWFSGVQYKKRNVMRMTLEELQTSGKIKQIPSDLFTGLHDSDMKWRELLAMIVKDKVRGKKVFTRNYCSILQRIIDSEDNMIRQFEKFHL